MFLISNCFNLLGAKVVVANGAISDMALHFMDRYEIMAIKVLSKFELRRVCGALGKKKKIFDTINIFETVDSIWYHIQFDMFLLGTEKWEH